MKFTASAALAATATGAAAQSSWGAWSSSKPVSASSVSKTTCPAPVTTVKTETTTRYQSTSEVWKSTVTVPIPEKPASFSVPPSWVDWDTTATGASATTSPSTCKLDKTVTSTSTITSTIAGTTTVTKSTLFVGVKATTSPEQAWAEWNPAKNANSPSATSKGNGNGNGNSNGNGYGNGNGNPKGSDSDHDGVNGNNGWGQGSWGGKGTGGLVLGEGTDIYSWAPSVPTNTKSGVAPQYTEGPHGWSGLPFGGVLDCLLDGNCDNDSNDDNGGLLGGVLGGNGGKNGHGKGDDDNGNGSGKNSTKPTGPTGTNTTSHCAIGDVCSNCTKPFEPLKDSECNSASDRSKWCGGADIHTDYYVDYWNDLKGVGDLIDDATGKSGEGKKLGHDVGGIIGGAKAGFGGSCNYDLVLTRGQWNTDGEAVDTILVNGQFPGPAIECNWGDLVTINVHNKIDGNGTAIHWHGIRQVGTNDQDGVPGVTECAVAPGQSRKYTFRASSYGTSWYHSHWNLQYGDGVQGPIIIHGPATANYDVDAGPVMLTDTFGMSASAFGFLVGKRGRLDTVNYLMNGKNTKPDLSAGQHPLWQVQKGKKYLFRIINSAAQNMYSVSIDHHKMKVIAADFVPIKPYDTEWLNIGIGQRYDVVVEMNQAVNSYFFRAVTQTLCPSGCKNSGLGQANGIIAYKGVNESPLQLPTSTMNGNKTAADFAICKDEPIASLVPMLEKKAGTASAFSASASNLAATAPQLVQTTDEGGVFRWFLNNGAMYVNYSQPTLQSLDQKVSLNSSLYANPIILKQKNEWVYFVIQNQFLAAHPMHLHGHDFSLLGQGDGLFTSDMVHTLNFDNPIRRDTAMLAGSAHPGAPTGGYTVIGFQTDNPGAWLMHCHIAWHVDGGLALQWIERPDDITSSGYTSASEFKNECSTYAAYEKQSPSNGKFSGQSGLRKREPTYFDKLMDKISHQHASVVRRDEHVAHHYLSGHLKRGLGDGSHRRSFGRRR